MPKRTINKSAFVREMGDMPAAEIVKKAKQRGFTLSVAHVHTIRSAAKRAGGGATKVRGRPRGTGARSGALQSAVDRLAGSFVNELLAVVRTASLEDILAV